jgi:hypothetical protein
VLISELLISERVSGALLPGFFESYITKTPPLTGRLSADQLYLITPKSTKSNKPIKRNENQGVIAGIAVRYYLILPGGNLWCGDSKVGYLL